MGLIVDVARGGDSVLEVGVGLAHEIYAVVPTQDGPTLTRGAVYSYYEFSQPVSGRMTDTQWKEMINSGKSPAQPEFTKAYRSAGDHKIPFPKLTQGDCWSDFPYDEIEREYPKEKH